MLKECLILVSKKLKSINFKNFDTFLVKQFNRIFLFCMSLTSIDFSRFNTSYAERLNTLVFECYSLTSIDLNNFDTANDYDIWYIFAHLYNIKYLDIKRCNVPRRRIIDFIFDDTPNTIQSTVIVNCNNEQQYLFEVIHEYL